MFIFWYGRIGATLKYHYQALDGFGEDILADPKLLTENVLGKLDFDTRAAMYIDTALFTFNDEQQRAHSENGWTRYRNVSTSHESCQDSHNLPGCDEVTMADWQPIGTLPAHGKRACGPKCLCGWEFDKGSLEGIEPFVWNGG